MVLMRGPRAASGGRAVVSVAASVSLHLLVGVGTTAVFLGGTLGAFWHHPEPPMVEIVAGEDRGRSTVVVASRETHKAARLRTPAPADMPPPQPVAATIAQAAADTILQPAADTIAQPAADTIAQPAADTIAQPAADTIAQTAADTTVPPSPAMAETAASTLREATHEGEPLAPGEVFADQIRIDEQRIAGSDGVPTTDSPAANPVPQVSLTATHQSRARLDEVSRNPSLSARAESEVMVGRPEMFEFLLDHPDFATHITRALRLARYRIWRTDDGMFIDDGWGATGQLTVVHSAGGTRMLYAKGEFQHKLLPPIPGEAVVTIDYETWPTQDGRHLLQARLAGQLKIDNAFATLMLKIASSVAREKAAKESRRLLQTFAKVLRAIDETPAAVYASVSARPDVPQHQLERFRVLLGLP
jgi:hypothetical protein